MGSFTLKIYELQRLSLNYVPNVSKILEQTVTERVQAGSQTKVSDTKAGLT